MLTVERIVLVLLLVCVGLFVGMAVGATLFVPADSGLAGPAIALAYGLVGGAAALAGGTIVARRLDARSLRRSLLLAGMLVAVITIWISCRLSVARAAEVAPEGAAQRIDLGVGETRPIAGNDDESGRSLNGRVEVRCR